MCDSSCQTRNRLPSGECIRDCRWTSLIDWWNTASVVEVFEHGERCHMQVQLTREAEVVATTSSASAIMTLGCWERGGR